MTPIIIFNQADAALTTIESYDEIKVSVRQAACADTKKKFFLVEIERRFWSQTDPEDVVGKIHRAGVYRTKNAATDELLRLWHIRDNAEYSEPYIVFTFQEDPEPVHALEISNLLTAFI